MSTGVVGPPRWVSHRRHLEQKLSDLHKCSTPTHVKQIHAHLIKSDLHLSLFVAPKLMAAYSLSHQLDSALVVFRQVPNPNAHLYNTLIRAHSASASPVSAFHAFAEMQRAGLSADGFTYPFLLKAARTISLVKMVHAHVVKSGFEGADIFVPNSLIDSYSRYGGTSYARKVFDAMCLRDVISWNSLICGLVRSGDFREARKLFDEMPERDVVSWNTLLDGYAKAGEMNEAFELFQRMPDRNVVSWSTVISGYCRKGDMEMARVLFDKMPARNLVTWTIMISGYALKGLAVDAEELFRRMLECGLRADAATVISIFSACAVSGLLGFGQKVHDYVVKNKMRRTTQLCNALIDMYCKCGLLDKAKMVFEGMALRDRVSWNSMVQGLAVHGQGERALHLFFQMEEEGIAPDGVTLIGVLCACTHTGKVNIGRSLFYSMEKDYGVVPQIEHYGCMVDLLARGGFLSDAFDLANRMPFEPSAIIWGTLLSACRIHNNVELAEVVVDRLIKLDPSDSGVYAIMSNIYANAGRWDGMAKIRRQMKDSCNQKPAGSSLIEVGNVVHEFTIADKTHPHAKRILAMLDRLGEHLKQAGYVPKAQYANA